MYLVCSTCLAGVWFAVEGSPSTNLQKVKSTFTPYLFTFSVRLPLFLNQKTLGQESLRVDIENRRKSCILKKFRLILAHPVCNQIYIFKLLFISKPPSSKINYCIHLPKYHSVIKLSVIWYKFYKWFYYLNVDFHFYVIFILYLQIWCLMLWRFCKTMVLPVTILYSIRSLIRWTVRMRYLLNT